MADVLQKLVGSIIRQHREAAGMSQAELASRAARSVQLIGRIERGESAPSFDTLGTIATALGTTPGRLFGPQSSADAPEARSVLDKVVLQLAVLPPDDLRWIEGVLTEILRGRRRP